MSDLPEGDAQAHDQQRASEPPGASTAPYAQMDPGAPPHYAAARRPARGAYADPYRGGYPGSYEEFRREMQQQRDDASESPSSPVRETGPYGQLTAETPFGAPTGDAAPTGRLTPLPPQPPTASSAPPAAEFAMRPRLSTPAPPPTRPATRAQPASLGQPASELHGALSDLLRPPAGPPPAHRAQPPAPPTRYAPTLSAPPTAASASQTAQATSSTVPSPAYRKPVPSGHALVEGAERFSGPAGVSADRAESEAESSRGGEHTDTAPSEVHAPFESDEELGDPSAFDETARAGNATAFQGTPGFIGTGAFRRPGRFARIGRSGKGAEQPDPGHPYDPGTADTHRPPDTDADDHATRQTGDELGADPYDRPQQDEYDRTATGPHDAARSSSDARGPVTAAPAVPGSVTAAPGAPPPASAPAPAGAAPGAPAPVTAAFMTANAAFVPAPMAPPHGSAVGRSETEASAAIATAATAGAATAPANATQLTPGGQPADHAEPPTAWRAAGTERAFPNDASSTTHPPPETSRLFDGIEHNAAVESTSAERRPLTSEPSFAMYPHESSQFAGSTQPAPAQPTPAQPTAAQPAAVVKGRVHIEDTVIEKVAALASQDVAGVAGIGGYASRVPEPARDRPGIGGLPRVEGARARIEDRQAWVDVVIVIEYGVVVMDVANTVKANVAHALSHMLGLRVAEVNVSITDVEMPRAGRPGAHASGATEASRP